MKDSPQNFYYFAIVLLALSLWLMWFFTKTPFGQVQLAIRENAKRIDYLGFKVPQSKAVIYLVSAAFAGVAGSLYGLFHNLVSADGALGALVSFAPIINIMIGGIGSFMGPILGTAMFQVIEEVTSRFTDRVELVIGLIFVFVIMYRAAGSARHREDAQAKMACGPGCTQRGAEDRMNILETKGLFHDFSGLQVLLGRQPADQGRRAARGHRTERRGQDDTVQRHHRHLHAEPRAGVLQGPRRHRVASRTSCRASAWAARSRSPAPSPG